MNKINLKNIARGYKQYRFVRHKIFEIFKNHQGVDLSLSQFLKEKLLKIEEKNWINLSLSQKDKKIYTFLRSHKSNDLDLLYLELITSYIEINVLKVKKLDAIRKNLNKDLFEENIANAQSRLNEFDAFDKQSLFFLKYLNSTFTDNQEKILQLTKFANNSEYVAKVFSVPLLYYYLNVPNLKYIDDQLSYTLPNYHEEIERILAKIFLNNAFLKNENFSFISYVALLTHPYDARDFILTYIENLIIEDPNKVRIDSSFFKCLERIDNSYSCIKSKGLLNEIRNEKDFSLENLKEIALLDDLNVNADIKNVYIKLFSNEKCIVPSNVKYLQRLANMFAMAYPRPDQYELMVIISRKYSFTDFGVFLEDIMRSLYLLERNSQHFETQFIRRLCRNMGCQNFFAATSPSAYIVFGKNKESLDLIEKYIELNFHEGVEGYDRNWIKAVNWNLTKLEQENKIKDWLETVRGNISIAPEYFTGISWEWLQNTVSSFGIEPFQNSNGAYALLLRSIEIKETRCVKLKSAVERESSKRKFEQFVDYLISEYSENAGAFISYFLTPEIILLLRFSNNYLNACSYRKMSIEKYVEKFGYTSLITEELMLRERAAYASEILFKNLSSYKFNTNWDLYKKDAISEHGDSFSSLLPFLKEQKESSNNREEKVWLFDHKFANGVAIQYKIKNDRNALMRMICMSIDHYISHPTQGIEALLSIRIRHHRIQKEFDKFFNALQSDGVVISPIKDELLGIIEGKVKRLVQDWVDKYIHQKREGKPEGLFNFIPEEKQIKLMLDTFSTDTYDSLMENLIYWLGDQLNTSANAAKVKLSMELRHDVIDIISRHFDDYTQAHAHLSTHSNRAKAKIIGSMHALINELCEWFNPTDQEEIRTIALSDLEEVIRQYYEDDENLELRFPEDYGSIPEIPKDVAINVMDLFCQIIDNAISYSTASPVRLSMRFHEDLDNINLVFASRFKSDTSSQRTIKGEVALKNALSNEGKSGLKKVANFSALLTEGNSEIKIVEKSNMFYVIVPVRRKSTSDGKRQLEIA